MSGSVHLKHEPRLTHPLSINMLFLFTTMLEFDHVDLSSPMPQGLARYFNGILSQKLFAQMNQIQIKVFFLNQRVDFFFHAGIKFIPRSFPVVSMFYKSGSFFPILREITPECSLRHIQKHFSFQSTEISLKHFKDRYDLNFFFSTQDQYLHFSPPWKINFSSKNKVNCGVTLDAARIFPPRGKEN